MSLSNSQDLNIQDDIGWNPLMLAASNGHLDIVRYLCDRGADVDIRDTRGLELQMKVHNHGEGPYLVLGPYVHLA